MRWVSRFWPLGMNGSCALVIALSSVAYGSYALEAWPFNDRRPLRERYHFTKVSRSDLVPVLSAPGRLDSSKKTVVRCELENIAGGGAGTGASVILSLLPEGTAVKAGDVLARLDASTYDEMYRQQTITVEQAKASHLQAQLNLEIALMSVREYREGMVQEMLKGMEGAIALADSDLSRATQRLAWTKRMNEKGYASFAQIMSDQDAVSRMGYAMKRQVAALGLFKRFTEPKTIKTLQGQVKSAETVLGNETLRLQRQLERLAKLKSQVDRCTIRAPQDGVLFYYKGEGDRRTVQIDEGLEVRQKQPLFYLPDLRTMEVVAALNESVVDRVRPGLPAKVTFEALPKLSLTGRVVSISQIPVRQNERGEDIRYFISTIKLDQSSPHLKPGMTTLVEIALARQDDVLAIPHQAIRSDHGKKFCYLARDDELERREVKIGHDTCDMVEVLRGLDEGDLVALDPPKSETYLEPLVNFDDSGSVHSDHEVRAASIR
jgi:HlyD family secretion protein